MPPDPKDLAYMWDMLDAARTTVAFTAGMKYGAFLDDRRTRNAVERNLEVLGEAARRVSNETRDQHQEIPWKSMIGLRNILAHDYGDIRHEILWDIIVNKLGPLILVLESIGVDPAPQVEDE
jgi:uncharacterized protein with HEPN domain